MALGTGSDVFGEGCLAVSKGTGVLINVNAVKLSENGVKDKVSSCSWRFVDTG